jgi:hypothetical protein
MYTKKSFGIKRVRMRKAESDVTEMVEDEEKKVSVNREKPWQNRGYGCGSCWTGSDPYVTTENKPGLDLHLAGNSFLWAFTIHILYVWW